MASSPGLNGFEKLAIVAAMFTSALLVGDALNAASVYVAYGAISSAMQLLGLFGWFVATFGPIGIAIIFWRLAKRLRRGWLLHLLFLPSAVALLLAGEALMLFVAGVRDFDDTLGGPVLQAYVLFLVAVLAYAGAVVVRAVAIRRRPGVDLAARFE